HDCWAVTPGAGWCTASVPQQVPTDCLETGHTSCELSCLAGVPARTAYGTTPWMADPRQDGTGGEPAGMPARPVVSAARLCRSSLPRQCDICPTFRSLNQALRRISDTWVPVRQPRARATVPGSPDPGVVGHAAVGTSPDSRLQSTERSSASLADL